MNIIYIPRAVNPKNAIVMLSIAFSENSVDKDVLFLVDSSEIQAMFR
jgi:hypothetical protein